MTLLPAHPAPGQTVGHNLTLFHTIGIYLANLDSGFWMGQMIGNLVLLLPFGLLGPVAVPWLDRWWRVLIVALALSSAVELAQLWVPDRSADVDDVLLNVVGAMLGYGTVTLLRLGSGRLAPSPNATDPPPVGASHK